jgi:hypothetical protein
MDGLTFLDPASGVFHYMNAFGPAPVQRETRAAEVGGA